jgi:outer membrane protein
MITEIVVKTTMRILSLTKQVTLKAACILLVAAFAGPALAQDAAPLKIAILDMGGALFNSERAKVVTAQIQAETAEDEQKVRALAEQATGLQQKLEQDAAVMSEEEKRKTTEQIQEIGVQYQFLVQKLQTLMDERREQFQNTHAQSLIQAIQAVIEEGQYDVVIRAETALHYNTEYDITARVTEKLNQQP